MLAILDPWVANDGLKLAERPQTITRRKLCKLKFYFNTKHRK